MKTQTVLPELLTTHETEALGGWMNEQLASITLRANLMWEAELRQQAKDFLAVFRAAAENGDLAEDTGPSWEETRGMLDEISWSRASKGFSPNETATFVLSLKRPRFTTVVEDEGAILELALESLEQLGYTVLTASSPGEALRASEGCPGRRSGRDCCVCTYRATL
jgi:rsbT co-antagonist protein RsbR